ncbi:MAG: M28 family peptidase [Candidatus Marinimicrobia bacterium]|nr:M28 family peptidase [Candidatus Neomarinimicrobiota bacterium]
MKRGVKGLLLLFLVVSNISAESPTFDGEKAFTYLLDQTNMGPRNPGSKGHQTCIEWLINIGDNWADSVVVQPFTGFNPFGGKGIELINIIYRFNPNYPQRIFLSAHFDTRPIADYDSKDRFSPILGANDGASGVAVLLHLSELFSNNPPPVGVDIIFWDGEDLGRQNNLEEFCQGSRFYSQNPIKPVPEKGIVIDMIGDADLQIYYELYSLQFAPHMLQEIWTLAKNLGYADVFIPKPGQMVYDDHVPLSLHGIPTIDIIDFQYPNASRNYWHTHEDTPDKCSPESLKIVGDVLLTWIFMQE